MRHTSPSSLGLEPRETPYCHATWLAPYLAGERHCLFNLQQQIGFCTPRSSGMPGDWATRHERLLQSVAARHAGAGRVVRIEQENGFRAVSRCGVTIHGQCDVVVSETPERAGVIADAKTGRPRGKDRAQVLIYMALAPWLRDFEGISRPPSGELAYADGRIESIPAKEAGEAFRNQLAGLLRLGIGAEPEPSPSTGECRFCRLAEICPHRAGAEHESSRVDWL